MRIAALLVVTLFVPLAYVYAAAERIILGDVDINSAPIEKLNSSRALTELGFRMAGIEVTPTVAVNGQSFQSVAPLTSIPEQFGETGEDGLPELPLYSQLVAIPDEAAVVLEIISAEFETLGGYDIMPSQPSTIEGSSEIPAFTRNEEFYKQDAFYPPEPVTLGEPAICRDLRMIQTVIYPVQYNPATRQLRVFTHIDYRLSYEGIDMSNAKVRKNGHISETFLPVYRALVPNADEMLADYQPIRGGYLIITPNAFADTIKVLERWKHLKGYYTQITQATDIDPDGILAPEQVFAYIQNAYLNWEYPPEFVCLVGDEDLQIPDYIFNNNYASDHRYSCVDGSDYISDIMVTRMSVSSAISELQVAMYKAIKYETDPYMGDPNYWTRGLSVAGNVTSGGAPTVSPRLVTLWVRQQLLEHGFSQVDTSFRWGSGSDPLLPGYFNNGVSIISYRGWASSSGWYVPSFDISNLNSLQANNKMGIMASLVCGTGDFDDPTYNPCFGEKWIRMGVLPNLLKGGPCFYSSSDHDTNTKWNNSIMIGYYWALLEENIRNFATAAFLGKMELYRTFPNFLQPGARVERYFYSYNTLGDPELEVRMAIPRTMTATYPDTIPVGTSILNVHVNGIGGGPLEGAYVNLVKGYGVSEEVFVGGRTNTSGDVTLNFSTANADTMFVTVSANDYIPHKAFTLVQNQTVALNVSAIAMSDDSTGGSMGNNDGNVNPSETVELAVTLRNYGTSVTATNVSATLVSVDPDVNVTIPTQSYPSIAPGATENAGQFAAHFAADIPQGEHRILRLNITSTQGTWTAAIPVDVKSMSFAVTGLSYPGNPNNRLDPGEASQLVVNLTNRGELGGTSIVGHLSSSDTAIVIADSLADFGNIGIGGSGSNTASPFMVQVRSGVYNGHNVNFDLDAESSNGSIARRSFSAVVGAVNTYDPIGPDNYGYYIYDDTDVGCLPAPIYNWVEIASGLGTRVNFPFSTDDDAVVVSLPFNFVYYGQTFNYALVSINGFVAFDTTRYDMQGHHWASFDNSQIPEPGAPRGLIGPFWDDLEYTVPNGVFKYNDSANHRFIIEWKSCNHPNAPGQHPETFEMILHDPSYYPTPTGDAEILFQYQTVYNDDNDNWDDDAPGLYATVGMQSIDNMDGLQYTYDNLYHPAAAILAAGRAIKITTATGVTPPPDISFEPSSFFKTAPAGQIVTDTLSVSNLGIGSLVFSIYPVTNDRILSAEGSGNFESSSPPENIDETPIVKKLILSNPDNPPMLLNQGGPDAFGNRWIDSDEPGGPPVTWVDISSLGVQVTLGDDNYVGPISIGFNFPFYENTYSQLYIGSNGFLSFGAGSGINFNVPIPNTSAPNNFILAFWDDVNPNAGGSVRYYNDTANQRFIVSFINVPLWSYGGSLNFQMLLYPSGRIEYNYGTLNPGTGSLASCAIGIENATGTDGLQVVNDAAYLHSYLSIVFFPHPTWLYTNLYSAILGGGADTFAVITFDATDLEPGIYTGRLDLDSNDPDEGSIDIPLTFTVGSQGAPDIAFYPDSLLDSLSEGQIETKVFKVYNRGTADLQVNLSAVEFNPVTGDDGPIGKLSSDQGANEIVQDILNTWLFISPAADTIQPGDSLVATVTFDARFVGSGRYDGEIRMASNDPDSPNLDAGAVLVVFSSGPNCSYIPGDINNSGEANGIDVTYGVSYLKGGSPPPYSCDCPPHGVFYICGDVNGNCSFNGIDITYYVAYLKGMQPALIYCEDCPPSRQILAPRPASSSIGH
ncbi:MAG: hypothetical protein A2W25_17170 [candidate division Zixibacteria bacterium RBG_16_53_22]|nr:MAG: hypothetical protein A2W25_17170 [candidate division Zixibacteria bacterium RBG_16_53_22]